MPTSKLWIEHTERAAWESVQALREKLADAEKRIEKLAPPTENWRELLELLEGQADPGQPAGTNHAEQLRRVLERLTLAEARLETQDADLERLRQMHVAAPVPVNSAAAWAERGSLREDLGSDEDDDEGESDERSSQRFVRSLERRVHELLELGPPRFSTVVSDLERKLDDLLDAGEDEITPHAVELAALALCLTQAVRHTARTRARRRLESDPG